MLSSKPIKGHRPVLGGSRSPASELQKGFYTTGVFTTNHRPEKHWGKARLRKGVGLEKASLLKEDCPCPLWVYEASLLVTRAVVPREGEPSAAASKGTFQSSWVASQKQQGLRSSWFWWTRWPLVLSSTVGFQNNFKFQEHMGGGEMVTGLAKSNSTGRRQECNVGLSHWRQDRRFICILEGQPPLSHFKGGLLCRIPRQPHGLTARHLSCRGESWHRQGHTYHLHVIDPAHRQPVCAL